MSLDTPTPPAFSADIPAGGAEFLADAVGPDWANTIHTPEDTEHRAADPSKSKSRKPFGGLGANKARASGVRKLTNADIEKLAEVYRTAAFAVTLFHPRLGSAVSLQAEACAESWRGVAEENDRVRRAILALIEGGQWGSVVVAHLPLIIAALPESVVGRLFSGDMLANLMGGNDSGDGGFDGLYDENGALRQ